MDAKKLFVIFLPVAVAGCGGGMHKVACTGENWYQLGFDYAADGKSVRAFDQYRDHCGDSLEDNAMNEYLDGYAKGLVEHCTYQSGYERGFHNKKALDVCPVEMRAAYVDGYKRGQIVGDHRTEHFRKLQEKERALENSNFELERSLPQTEER